MTVTRHDGLMAALLVALTLIAYVGYAPTEFVYDDRDGIQESPAINGELPWTAAFTRDFWGRDKKHTVATYRPVAVLVSRLSYRLGGGTPTGFRVTAIVLHLGVLLASWFAFIQLTPRKRETDLIVTATVWLVALCAATSEAVLCHVGNADILCALAATIGLVWHRRPGKVAAAIASAAFLLALGSKESGIMVPLAWLAFDEFVPAETHLRQRLPRFGIYGLLVIPYLFARKYALGALLLPWTNGSLRNPLVTLGFFARELSAANVFLTKYLLGIVLPWRRIFDCSANACGPASFADPVAWIALVVWLAFLIAPFLLRTRAPLAAAGLAWFILFFLPGSNFLVTGPTIYGERLLYLPCIGLFLAASVGFVALARRLGHRGVYLMLPAWAFLLANGFVVRQRLEDWSSNAKLAKSGLRYAADSAIVQVNLAVEARPERNYIAVEEHARKAIEIDPREMPPHRELAAALFATGREDEARQEFEKAYAIRQDEVLVFDYANFLGKVKEYDRGRAIIARYIGAHPGHPRLMELSEKLRRAAERSAAGTAPPRGHE